MVGSKENIGRKRASAGKQPFFASHTDIPGEKKTSFTVLQHENKTAVVGRPGKVVIEQAIHSQALQSQLFVLIQDISCRGLLHKGAMPSDLVKKMVVG